MTECIDTILELLEINPVPGENPSECEDQTCVIVKGYHKPGDGGGGTFFWDGSYKVDPDRFPEGEDFGTVLKPTSFNAASSGRWVRIFEEPVSVKWFGARGDMRGTKEEAKGKDGRLEVIKGDISKDTLTLKGSTFSEDDVGKIVVLWDEKMVNRFVAKIVKINSATLKEATLDKVLTVIPGVNVSWGTDDTVPIQRALDLAKETGVSVYLPPGHYLITQTLNYLTVKPIDAVLTFGYPIMRHGLQMFGAGAKVSFIHNQILTEDDKEIKEDNPTIRIDGGASQDAGKIKLVLSSFNNTGLLKDFHITSTGQNPGTVGIDMRNTWFHTIQNVHIMKMGSHAIKIRNEFYELKTSSDYSASSRLHFDNVFAYRNEGWGIIVDAIGPATSVGFTYIESCWLEQNKLGGIQWVGQIGAIENSGIYGNGVNFKIDENTPDIISPEAIAGGYGILVKNVKATPNGLLISRCEIQDNAEVQVMIESGSNIRIVQNEFKVDNLAYHFPSVDIQVGDGNLGDTDINALNHDSAKTSKYTQKLTDSISAVNEFDLEPAGYGSQVIKLQGTLTKKTAFYFPVDKVRRWLLINETKISIKYGNKGDKFDNLPSVLANSWNLIDAYRTGPVTNDIRLIPPRAVNNCVIEDNYSRITWNPIGSKAPAHTLVKVNTNAQGTVIRGWFLSGWNEDATHKVVELMENDPITHERVPIEPIQYPGRSHINTSLHRDGTDGGHVLLPFAAKQEFITKPTHEYTPDTSRWCSYRFRLMDDVMLLVMKNPTTRTIGTPLFLEFANVLNRDIMVEFGNKIIIDGKDTIYNEYNISSLVIPRAKTVTGILLFGIGNKWTLFSPWACEGLPNYLLSSGVGDPIPSSNTIEPTHQIHHITGTLSISNIIPPLGFAGELMLIPDGAWKTDTTGNIKNGIIAIVDRPVRCIYDNKSHKWFLVT